jgi:hypothetical protein
MAGLPQMPDTSGLDPEQLSQMLALVSMGGMGAMMPPPMPGVGFPGAAPPAFDPAMAQVYSQMLSSYFQQNLQQQLGTPNTGMPFAFPGQMPQQSLQLSDPTVKVSVEGMKFQYQLTEDDIHKVFCRYGKVTSVSVDEACSSALVTFSTMQDAQAAISDLDGKVLNGLDGTLRIQWMSQPPNPSYMGMNPGMSLPGFPQAPSNPFGFGVSNLPGMPSSSPPNMGMGDVGKAGAKGRKFTCRFLIGIENDKEFQVVRRLIGSKGSNMKKIVQQTEAKLRLRGVGSGYFEGSSQKESSEPLQLCISCCKIEGYKTAVRLVEELLKRVYEEYRQFCHENGLPIPDLQISLSENPVMTTPRGGASGMQADSPQPYGMPAQIDPTGKKEHHRGGGGAKAKNKKGGDRGSASSEGDRGTPGPNAPTPEEITRFINDRNEARRSCNFAEADRIRELLHTRGVALMDEPGARGKGQDVTTWRYWHD